MSTATLISGDVSFIVNLRARRAVVTKVVLDVMVIEIPMVGKPYGFAAAPLMLIEEECNARAPKAGSHPIGR
jgi:hypothetical protein